MSTPDTAILHDYLILSCEQDANRVALVMGSEELTYAALEVRAHAVGSFINQQVPLGGVVGIWAAPDTAAYVAIFGTWMACRGYVPLHPD